VERRGAFPWGAHPAEPGQRNRDLDTGHGCPPARSLPGPNDNRRVGTAALVAAVLLREWKDQAGSVSRCQAVLVLMVAVEAKPVVEADRDLIRRVYLEIDRTGAVVGGPFGEATHDV
jgi:hypothetical protein